MKYLCMYFVLLLSACDELYTVDPMSSSNFSTAFSTMEREKQSISTSSQKDQFQFVRKYLKPWTRPLSELALNSELRSLLYKSIELQLDGDYSVPLEYFFNEDINNSETGINEFKNRENLKHIIESSLEAFKNINGIDDHFPEIFIPFYEQHKSNGLNMEKLPVIVIYD